MEGKPLAPDGASAMWTGVFLFFEGDLEFFAKDFKFNSYNSNSPCGLCGANRLDVPWNDFGRNARWMRTVMDNTAFRAYYIKEDAHPFWRFFPGITRHTIRLDTLHINDHHGVLSILSGNILWEVVHDHELPACRSADKVDCVYCCSCLMQGMSGLEEMVWAGPRCSLFWGCSTSLYTPIPHATQLNNNFTIT